MKQILPLYFFSGTVITGKKRGRELGFPTANVLLTQKIPEGIYASIVEIEGKKHSSASFIGAAKTFNEHAYKAEVHILDFNQEIYGSNIKVSLLYFIRKNKKFPTVPLLKSQMESDILKIRNFFNLS